MSNIHLPTELWLNIATYVEDNDHKRLVLVCRGFHDIFTDLLYANLIIPFPEPSDSDARANIRLNVAAKGILSLFTQPTSRNRKPSRFGAAGSVAASLLERLETDSRLRNSVRSVHIKNLRKNGRRLRFNDPQLDTRTRSGVYDALGGVLEGLPFLQNIEMTNVEMHATWLVRLTGHPTAHLKLQNAVIYGKGDSIPPSLTPRGVAGVVRQSPSQLGHRPRNLAFLNGITWYDCASVLTAVLSNPTFEILHLGPEFSGDLFKAFNLLGRPSLPHLQSLTMDYITSNQLGLLNALPNLRVLEFYGMSAYVSIGRNDIPRGDNGIGILPRLERISAACELVRGFTAGRSIVSIAMESREFGGSIDVGELEFFGSKVMVRTVEWRKCLRIETLLDYLLERNPGVWHLSLTPAFGRHYKFSLKKLFPKLMQLHELHTLQVALLGGPLTERDLRWQREQCEYLGKNGSPYLLSISFHKGLTWTRHPEDEAAWRPHWSGEGKYGTGTILAGSDEAWS